VKWDRAVELSTIGVAFRVTEAKWPEPDFVRMRGAIVTCYNRNTPGDAGLWSTCPFRNAYDHDDWQPMKPRDAVTALGLASEW